jgi:hypothetical protein
MTQKTLVPLAELYEADETAWLDGMVQLMEEAQLAELDYPHLVEYLRDMANRDRREVESRLRVLLTHVLKWEHQPELRIRSWRGTIVEQRHELEGDAGTGVLRQHAEAILPKAYQKAVERAAIETGLAEEVFPTLCPYSFEQLLSRDLLSD